MSKYIYLGDRLTDDAYKNKLCNAIQRTDGKCIRGKSNMLVSFGDDKVVVLARRLRKILT